ncbi:restriction endonuclease subunit S [Paenalcaligenes suwonensis]|uniref:restriction endonuclease subunit S n=1 Tax=Paenalcaligenes suwonensis TaxID=1202713 RepID=UPI0014099BA3|nr:restriction endonuclease subunit S [Paenalcaligenes suwonensis]NHC59988.1 restriction endonuclease subunit S [Paenalcaligenes suwonensis]
MASKWRPTVFGDLVDFVSEKAKAQDAAYATYVSTENMQADFGGVAIAATVPKSGSVTKFSIGDTLFSNIRTYFKKIWQAEFDGYCSNDVLVFRTKDETSLHPGFLNNLCRWEKFTEFSIRTSKGAKMPRGDKDALAQFKFELPSIEEQRAIAKTLRSFDNKIDLSRRINQTLEAMAQAIFKSWFVDFDPVKAKITAIERGEDPLRAAMRAISGKTDTELDLMPREHHDQLAATAALFPDAMEASELGEIPKGWTHSVLGDVCSFTAGSAFKPEHQGSTEGDYPFIKVSDMNLAGNEVFIQSANNYVSKAQQSEMKAKLHPLGATVFAKIGVALISNRRRLLTTPTIIDNNLMSASPVEGKSGAYFLYSMLSTIDFNTLVSGTALPYLNVSDLKKIPIVRPPHNVGCAFERKASSIFSMMQTLAEQSSTLADTRDNLLPKLLSGEVKLSETLEG